jgi:carbon storage regulator
MHVISRRTNEGVVINGDIFVTVLEIRGDCVRLAISAPHHMPTYWEQTLYLQSEEESAELEFSHSMADGYLG